MLATGIKIAFVFLECLDAAFRKAGGQRTTVEYATLTGTTLNKGHPFFEEFLI